VILFLLTFLSLPLRAETPELQTQPAVVVPTATPIDSAAPAKESSDYEVDYEEEPGSDEVEEPVVDKPVTKNEKKSSSKKNPKESASQGSRAEKKIAPMMKSETKSIYKKNGKSLDVDSD
jgi:hypothetical protein